MAIIIDSYSETNYDGTTDFLDSNEEFGEGQSFTGSGGTLNNCKFYLERFGSPTGNAVAKIYAHSGTFGTSSVPTGAALATSDNLDVSTIPVNFSLITLNFTGANKITLTNGTHYVVTLEYSGGDVDNSIVLGAKTSGTHPGNSCSTFDGSTWTAYNSFDDIFYVYKDGYAPSALGTINEWTSPTNVYLSDNVYASAGADTTNNEQMYKNFNLPDYTGLSINGLEVFVEAKDGDATPTNWTMTCRLSSDGGSTWTATKSQTWSSTSDTVLSFGGSADTWGRGWSASALTNANFMMDFVVTSGRTTATFKIDQVYMQVTTSAGTTTSTSTSTTSSSTSTTSTSHSTSSTSSSTSTTSSSSSTSLSTSSTSTSTSTSTTSSSSSSSTSTTLISTSTTSTSSSTTSTSSSTTSTSFSTSSTSSSSSSTSSTSSSTSSTSSSSSSSTSTTSSSSSSTSSTSNSTFSSTSTTSTSSSSSSTSTTATTLPEIMTEGSLEIEFI